MNALDQIFGRKVEQDIGVDGVNSKCCGDNGGSSDVAASRVDGEKDRAPQEKRSRYGARFARSKTSNNSESLRRGGCWEQPGGELC